MSKNVEPNSLGACIVIYNHLLSVYKSPFKAIKKYKGIKSKENEYLIHYTLKLKSEVLQILKEQ